LARFIAFAGLSVTCLVGSAHLAPARAESDPSVQSWRIIQPAPRIQPPAPQPYRARRRYDAPKYPDDSTLGLHMPEIKVAMPLPEDAQRIQIAVVGDSLADSLVGGMEADRGFLTDFLIRQRTVSASGLVREDFHHWPRAIATLASENPGLAALVILVGLNDRQPLRNGEAVLDPLTEPWREIYRQRIDAVIEAARAARLPLIWVGMPVMRSARLSTDIAALNDLIRERVMAASETFVETYDGFSDQAGGFSASGPDIIGDIVRLRGPDGIHFTPAGQRKLAFFVEKPLRRKIEERRPGAGSLPVAAPSAPNAPGQIIVAIPPSVPTLAPIIRQRPEIGEMRPLSQTPTAASLIGRGATPPDDPATRELFERGIAPAPRAGRSDDYRWR
jgi:hypothetical protein